MIGGGPEQRPGAEANTVAHEHRVVRIRGVWEEPGGLFEINRRVCLECAQILEETLVGLPERRNTVRTTR